MEESSTSRQMKSARVVPIGGTPYAAEPGDSRSTSPPASKSTPNTGWRADAFYASSRLNVEDQEKQDRAAEVERLKSMAARAKLSQDTYKSKYLIDPRKHHWMAKWDLLVVFALMFTAIVTPLEVVFLDEGFYLSTLWVLNRVIDLTFTIDILIIFNLIYMDPIGGVSRHAPARHARPSKPPPARRKQDSKHMPPLPDAPICLAGQIVSRASPSTFCLAHTALRLASPTLKSPPHATLIVRLSPAHLQYWVTNRGTITISYLKSWFLIDILSIIPFWIVTFDFADPLGANAALLAAAGTNEGGCNSPTILMVFRLLRLLKLARVLKASKVLQRQLLDIAMNRWEWTYAVLNIIKLVAVLCLYAHWQACLWGLVSSYQCGNGTPNWLRAFNVDFLATIGYPAGPMDRYWAALYWSVMTLTGIGYGEMLPINTVERVLCTV